MSVATAEIKIRPLKRKDRKTISNMILNLVDKLGDDSVLSIISIKDSGGEKKEESKNFDPYIKTGFELIKLMFQVIEDDCAKWFADLLQVKPEELDDLPFDVEMQIIQQIMEAPEVGNFFSIASGQYKKIQERWKSSKEGKKK